MRELIEMNSDAHHIIPCDYLKKGGPARGQYNQIANYVVAQSEINIAIATSALSGATRKDSAVEAGSLTHLP